MSKVICTLKACKGALSFYNHYFSMLTFFSQFFEIFMKEGYYLICHLQIFLFFLVTYVTEPIHKYVGLLSIILWLHIPHHFHHIIVTDNSSCQTWWEWNWTKHYHIYPHNPPVSFSLKIILFRFSHTNLI